MPPQNPNAVSASRVFRFSCARRVKSSRANRSEMKEDSGHSKARTADGPAKSDEKVGSGRARYVWRTLLCRPSVCVLAK